MTNMLARHNRQTAARWTSLILMSGLTLSTASAANSLAQPVAASVWRRAVDLSGVGATEAKTRVRMIIFFDADCPFCATLWSRLHAAAATRGVRWVPVAYFDSSSPGREASILLAKDPLAALDMNFRLYDRAKSRGAAVAPAVVPAAVAAHLQANAAFWANLGAMTPLILYRRRTGESLCFYGLPDDAALARILEDLAAADLDPFSEAARPMGVLPQGHEDMQP